MEENAIRSAEHQVIHTFLDGYLRSLCCLGVEVMGIWLPLSLPVVSRGRYNLGADAGIVVALAFIIATVFAFRAADKLCRAYQDSSPPDKRRHLAFITGAILLCWAPQAAYMVVIIISLVRAYAR